MRTTLAVAAAVQGYVSFVDGATAGRPFGLLLMAVACALATGVLTVAAAGLALAALAGAAALSVPIAICSACGRTAPLGFEGAVCIAVILLGPGAYSLDARLFGRREIVIPRGSRPLK